MNMEEKFSSSQFYNKLIKIMTTDGFQFEQKGTSSKRFSIDLLTPLRTGFEKIFDLSIKEEIFSEVCNGTGMEIAKIDSIWSSSLLSFLVFYSAMEGNGLEIEIPGRGDVTFKNAYFEFMNPTFANKPDKSSHSVSNMDCVLMDADKKTILFIESKFKEYVTDRGEKDKLSEKYMDDAYTKEIGKEYKKIVQSPTIHYLDGLKQLITHYSGLRNFEQNVFHNAYTKNSNDRRNEIIQAKLNGATFHFMEIVYDFSSMGYESALTDYCNDSRKIESAMTFGNPNCVLPLITYQELLNYKDNKAKIAPSIRLL